MSVDVTAAQFLEMIIVAGLRTYIYKGEFAYVHVNLYFYCFKKRKITTWETRISQQQRMHYEPSQLGIFNYKRTTTALLESGRIPLLHSTRRERGKDERLLQRMEQMSK